MLRKSGVKCQLAVHISRKKFLSFTQLIYRILFHDSIRCVIFMQLEALHMADYFIERDSLCYSEQCSECVPFGLGDLISNGARWNCLFRVMEIDCSIISLTIGAISK